VAVWGAGAVGQMAARAAMLLGAEQVVVIDRIPERLAQVRRYIGAETVDYSTTDVVAELRERTGGRGPDVCIKAVGMEAHSPGPQGVYDQVKQQVRLANRPAGRRPGGDPGLPQGRQRVRVGRLRRHGGQVSARRGDEQGAHPARCQQHGQRFVPRILKHMARGELIPDHLATHMMPLTDAPRGYRMFKEEDGCVRAVFLPHG
jgi:threonine dehydrogenase-like Zn-dependent dehydrogenase